MHTLKYLMTSLVSAALFIQTAAVDVSAAEDEFAGQRIVHLLDEPRHRTVYKDGELNLLDVQINPGDLSFPHTHTDAILLTYISTREGPQFGRVAAVTDYATEAYTHEVGNAGPGLLRILALNHSGSGIADLTVDRPDGVEQLPQLENPWFRSYRFTIAPGGEIPLQTHANPAVIVQATEGIVHVSRPDGITAELAAMGEWEWRAAGVAFSLRNPGTEPVEVVVNEARR